MLHPSGGLIYHLRAWRYGASLWRPFHEEVHRWLAGWQPAASHLVLAGPSGGYALKRVFLERFARVTVLEPDLSARWLLSRRFPSISFQFAPSPLAGPGGFDALARTWPDAAFLFCNLLGQTLAGQGKSFDRAAWLAGLVPALAGREWASWHDLISTGRAPDHPSPIDLPECLALDDLLGRFWQGGELEIYDHQCAGLASGRTRSYGFWRLTPRTWHLVEWLGSERGGGLASETIAPPLSSSTS